MRRYLIAPVAAAVLLLLPGSTGVAFAADTPDPQVVKVEKGVACGTVTLDLTNNDTGDYGFTWTTGPVDGGPAGAQGLIVAPKGETSTHTIHLPEDSFNGRAFVTLGVSYGPNTHRQAFLDLGLVDTDCDNTPPVTYPVDCEVTEGVDQGESGKQADADAPCVSNSPGYETDEVGDACDVATGELGGGDGVVTAGLKCEIPASPEVPFANCDEVRAAGFANGIASSDPRYQKGLDSDGDGLGCEPVEGVGPPARSATPVNSGSTGGSGTGNQVSVIPSDAPETGDGSTDLSIAHRLALAAMLINVVGIGFLSALQRGALRR